jgi:hypothetical protein
VAQSTKKRKPRNIDDEPDIKLAEWEGTPAAAAAGGEIAALTTNTTKATALPTSQLKASKRIKLPDTNKRKAVNLGPNDILQAKIGKCKGAAYISAELRRRTTTRRWNCK